MEYYSCLKTIDEKNYTFKIYSNDYNGKVLVEFLPQFSKMFHYFCYLDYNEEKNKYSNDPAIKKIVNNDKLREIIKDLIPTSHIKFTENEGLEIYFHKVIDPLYEIEINYKIDLGIKKMDQEESVEILHQQIFDFEKKLTKTESELIEYKEKSDELALKINELKVKNELLESKVDKMENTLMLNIQNNFETMKQEYIKKSDAEKIFFDEKMKLEEKIEELNLNNRKLQEIVENLITENKDLKNTFASKEELQNVEKMMGKDYEVLAKELTEAINDGESINVDTVKEFEKEFIKDYVKSHYKYSSIKKVLNNHIINLKITIDEYHIIRDHLQKIKVTKFKLSLIYLATRDGFGVSDAISRIKRRDNIVIIATTNYGHRIAFYTEQGFGDVSGTPIYNKRNMLFLNLSNPKEFAYGVNRINDNDSNVYFNDNNYFYARFYLENQTKQYDLILYHNSNTREDNFYYYFTSKSTENKFKTSEIEVYELID